MEDHTGDIETADIETADIETLGVIAADMDGVEAALVRIDAGTYGSCAVCGAAIDDAALDREPLQMSCGAHA